MKKIWSFLGLCGWVLGVIGGIGYACYSGAWVIAVAVLVLGVMDEEIGSEIELKRYAERLRQEGYKCFFVQSCADRSVGVPLPHYAAVGE